MLELLVVIGLAVLMWACSLVVWPNVACQNFLNDFIQDRLFTSQYQFRLYTSNTTPGTGSVLGDFTELAVTGYNPVAGSGVTWPAATLSGNIAQTTGSNIVFNNGSAAAVTIYGVFVTDLAKTKLYFAERDPAAPVSIPSGGSYVYTPNQQYKSIN